MSKGKPAKAQTTEPTYELHSLGWKAFQHLCGSITSEIWGQTVQGFFDSHDGGRDGAFYGIWSPHAGEIFEGSFTVQCKFTAKADHVLKIKDLGDEFEKAARLAKKGLSDNYFIFTNSRLTGTNEEIICETFEAIPGLNHCKVYGVEHISKFIRESPRLRMLIPRVYGLGDLSQILDERAYHQAHEILSSLGDDLAKFVITDAYKKSARAMVEHGFVMLLGEPACGKSTIAAALALGGLDEWKCSTLKIRDADEFVKHSNPHEKKQLFWIDDAFGATQLDWNTTVKWNSAFPHIKAAIKRGAKFVFTSRDYIYKGAKNILKESSLPLMYESQVVIHVEQLSDEERQQILYNHIRLGTQPTTFKSQLKNYLEQVAKHKKFSPEIARRLGDPAFTKKLSLSSEGLDDYVSKPMDFLQEILRTLDPNCRSAIALIFMRGGPLSSPVTLSPEEENSISLLGGTHSEVRNALIEMQGSLVIQTQHEGEYYWKFKHPTIRDAFAALIAENRELLDIYLTGTPFEQLFSEISCGDVGLEGVKVIVPEARFGLIIKRLLGGDIYTGGHYDSRNRFFAHRCNKQFLTRFIKVHPGFIEFLELSSYLYAVSDVEVVIRLAEFELLPEHERVRHVERIKELAVDTPDAGFLHKRFLKLITPDEFAEILNDVKTNLLSDLEYRIESWADNSNDGDDPEDYFGDLERTLSDYQGAFKDDEVSKNIEHGFDMIKETVEELRQQTYPEPEYNKEDFVRGQAYRGESASSRSIFDDVDQ